MKGDENLNKRLILSLLGISLFSIINSNLILKSEASNISKTQEDLSPLITYTTEKIGDREKMIVTVTVEDRSGSGIKEFRDYNNKLINSNTITVEFNRRVNATFTAIDNNNNQSEITIDLRWINPYTTSNSNIVNSRKKYGSAYWESSNMREWLNSASEFVSYTGLPPSNENTNNHGYDKEAGFLNEFNTEEINAIAVTERRNTILGAESSFKDGGEKGSTWAGSSLNTFLGSERHQYLAFSHQDTYFRKSNDKVFLLNGNELYWYIIRRGNVFDRGILSVNESNFAKNDSTWFLNSSVEHSSIEKMFLASTSINIGYTQQRTSGVVPAIYLKPTYLTASGKIAGDLAIGEKITFGRYKNCELEWEVINISDEGYPLLVSTKRIDYKYFDSIGDNSRLYSDYINFDNPEVLSVGNASENYKSTLKSNDTEPPKFIILNKDELEQRQNLRFTLNIRLADDSGLKYIDLPDGSRIDNFENPNIVDINFTVLKNAVYNFKYMDVVGNYNNFALFISNINEEPILDISYSSDWANSDSEVYIKSSNTVRFDKPSQIVNTNEIKDHTAFPNYISYAGQKFKIRGKIILKEYDENILDENPQLNVSFGFRYRNKVETEYTNVSDYMYPRFNYKITELINKGSIDFNFEYTVPNNCVSELSPQFTSISTNSDSRPLFKVEYRDVSIVLEDDSDFAINSIELPNGQIVENVKEYTDVISEDGIHNLTYKVLDNRGKTTQKTITVKVDKTAPILDLNYNANPTNQNIVVNISSSDATSGVKRIKLPNGNYITNSNSTYTISGDGEYIFECEDVAGNITTKTITINNIDKEKPNVIIDKNNTEWTNQGVQININTRD